MNESTHVDQRPAVHVSGPSLGRAHQEALAEATEALVEQTGLPVGEVVAAVARARARVLQAYLACQLTPPPPDEYVALVIGLARQALPAPVSPR